MRNSKVIREEIGDVRTALDTLSDLVKTEDRKFTDVEQTTWDADIVRAGELTDELSKIEKEEAIRTKLAGVSGNPVQVEGPEVEEAVKRFSFGDMVRGAYGDKLEGFALEMHQEGEREMQAVGQSSRGIVIPGMITNAKHDRAVIAENGTTGIEVVSFVDGVYANTILGDLGVTRLNSTTDQRIPIIPSVSVKWEGENDDAADGGSAITKKDLAPKRVATYLDLSKQAVMQHNQSLEDALRRGIQQALAAKIEYTVFTDDTAEGGFADIGAGKTDVAAATVTAGVMNLIEEVLSNNQNRGNLGFAIDTALYGEIYQAVLATGVSPLVVNEMIMGLPFRFSSQIDVIAVGEEAMYYGDWSKYYIANFGGIEILADPYTQAIGGKTRLVLNSYWDAVLAQDTAISVAGFTG